ncbi:hypothetical protein AVEN_227895-1 [Araneus ventricosus]|uniref:Uncharacterized protein n=1 Tax=Araneus ventricosus TaxID=182803 RepID=A0A4Y2S6Z2_ARAVE|nr:hypothetical protein AVEN_227895-1 [Araneus ventricosus]
MHFIGASLKAMEVKHNFCPHQIPKQKRNQKAYISNQVPLIKLQTRCDILHTNFQTSLIPHKSKPPPPTRHPLPSARIRIKPIHKSYYSLQIRELYSTFSLKVEIVSSAAQRDYFHCKLEEAINAPRGYLPAVKRNTKLNPWIKDGYGFASAPGPVSFRLHRRNPSCMKWKALNRTLMTAECWEFELKLSSFFIIICLHFCSSGLSTERCFGCVKSLDSLGIKSTRETECRLF